MSRLVLICAAALLIPPVLVAQPLTGSRAVYLEDAQGHRQHIADVSFDAEGRYSVTMQAAPFTDHFLSMRPFKCLEGPDKHWCHVPYPYPIARQVGPEDLTDLEYDFLFLWKGASDYGIDMWNGVYYRLTEEEGRLVGRLHEMDMGLLAVPPAEGVMRPLRDVDLEQSDPGSHWLPVLVIE
ncbi:hypothetical protein [Antarctobacter jejuensis]|uniref:hypothetical protein n=1 Tax=Antarctobacter jejuensis TaxID=1439938 RepID=UPI003FD4415E